MEREPPPSSGLEAASWNSVSPHSSAARADAGISASTRVRSSIRAVEVKTSRGVIRHQMIIDLASGTALAAQNIMLMPAAGAGIPAGRTVGSTVVVSSEWTDSHPR